MTIRKAVAIYISILVAIVGSLAAFFASGGWPAVPANTPGLGATKDQCQTAYGPSEDAKNAPGMDSVQNFYYNRGAWNVLVGFDHVGRAELFIFYKIKFPLFPLADLSSTEQKILLDRFADGSIWVMDAQRSNGPQWQRADKQASAMYITANHSLVIMNHQCLARKVKALPGNLELED